MLISWILFSLNGCQANHQLCHKNICSSGSLTSYKGDFTHSLLSSLQNVPTIFLRPSYLFSHTLRTAACTLANFLPRDAKFLTNCSFTLLFRRDTYEIFAEPVDPNEVCAHFLHLLLHIHFLRPANLKFEKKKKSYKVLCIW